MHLQVGNVQTYSEISESKKVATCKSGKGMSRQRFGICVHCRSAEIGVEGVKEGKVWPHNAGADIFKVGREAFIQPELPPVLHCH